MPTKLEANASFKKPRLVFLVLALALIFCVVFVGGVSGATWNVPADGSLADIVNNASNGDVIVITGDYVISEQVALSSNYAITITNAPGVDVTVSSGLTGGSADDGTLFKIDSGRLTVKGNDDGGSLTITTGLNGRAFDVDSDAVLNIYDGVIVYQCGFDSASSESRNGGAVYVNSGGEFIMHGGLLLNNTGYQGGAVYVNDGGFFELKKGKGIITNNHALFSSGGGVYAENSDNVTWTGGDIKGNTALSKCNNNENNICPSVACPEKDAPIYVQYKSSTGFYFTKDGFWSVSEAYDWAVSDEKGDGLTIYIYIRRNFTQGYIETWNEYSNSYTTKLDYVTIGNGVTTVNLKPATQPVCLNIIDQMFYASDNYFVIGAGSSPSLTISGKNEVSTVRNGGLLCVDGCTVSINNCEISDTKAKEGGAVYIKSGSITISDSYIKGCTSSGDGGAIYVGGGTLTLWDLSINGCVSSGDGGAVYVNGGILTLKGTSSSITTKITDCTSSGKGGAVYVGGGIFKVVNWATVDSSNDVYLSADQVITAESGYTGTIGNITLPSYNEGTPVVDVNTDSTGYPNKFILNPESNDGIERILVLKEEGSTNYLVLKKNIEYEVIIPPSIEISESTDTGTLPISVITTGISSNQVVRVYINGDFILDYQTDSTTGIGLNYTVLKDGGVALNTGGLVGEFAKYGEPFRIDLTARISDRVTYSGTYSDTLTFTSELETIE